MIDRAFTATCRLFSHTDYPTYVCTHVFVWTPCVTTEGWQVCISFLCERVAQVQFAAATHDKETCVCVYVSVCVCVWSKSKITLRLKVAMSFLNDDLWHFEKRGDSRNWKVWMYVQELSKLVLKSEVEIRTQGFCSRRRAKRWAWLKSGHPTRVEAWLKESCAFISYFINVINSWKRITSAVVPKNSGLVKTLLCVRSCILARQPCLQQMNKHVLQTPS